MRVRKGEGAAHAHAHVRDRACQQARREVYGGQEGVWAREDVLARLDGVALQAFDRMLRVTRSPSSLLLILITKTSTSMLWLISRPPRVDV